ncbi:MAG: hypothetical protein KAR39_06745 [Thermoplasmata archaeon]|nr:hypothetical protein [Thermoplasmata archaeon]
MGRKSKIKSPEEYFVREPFASVLRVLHSATDPNGEWIRLKPKEIRQRMKSVEISASRLSQVLGELVSWGLVEKNSEGYAFSEDWVFDLRKDYIRFWVSNCECGEIAWRNEGWAILGVGLDDSVESAEIRREVMDLATKTGYLREKIHNLMVKERLKGIAEHLRKVLNSSELSEKKKGYVLHYVRKEVRYPFIVRAAHKLPDEEKGEKEDVKSKAEARLEIDVRKYEPEWGSIMVPKLKSEKLSRVILDIAKEYDKGRESEFDREWLDWLFFEEFSQSDFQFECGPLLAFGDFTKIP